jgi:murein DD-endopeptidase MepM/ murein hydrolase activator NlpD
VYFKGVSGKMYWLGHIENALPTGTQVRANQPIAVVSSHHKNPHLHIDVLGGQ